MKAGKLKITGQINGAAVYLAKIGSSSTVRNPLFSVQKLIEQINATFLFVKKKNNNNSNNKQTKTSKMIGMSLNVVNRHVRQKRLTKKYNKDI